MPIKTSKLSDARIEALREFQSYGTFRDSVVAGLRVRVGIHRTTFLFFQEHRIRGDRSTTFRRLGFWPATSVADARKEALMVSGRIASGRIEPSRKNALKFADAFQRYVEYLAEQSADKGKAPRWSYNVSKLGKIILAKFSKWTLAEMSRNPEAVADWHREISKSIGKVTANKCAKIIRALYRRERKGSRNLPPDDPTMAVRYNKEEAADTAMPFEVYPEWLKAWKANKNPVQRAYSWVGLFTGARPGELAGLRWADVLPLERCFILRKTKSGADVRVPLSVEIVRGLKMARDAGKPGPLVFPGCAKNRSRLALPYRGHALRHSYLTVAATAGVDELIRHFLVGHAPEGISQKYIGVLILQNSQALRVAQRKISRRIIELLHSLSLA